MSTTFSWCQVAFLTRWKWIQADLLVSSGCPSRCSANSSWQYFTESSTLIEPRPAFSNDSGSVSTMKVLVSASNGYACT